MRYFLFIALVCLISCKAQKDAKTDAIESDDMELIATDAYSGILEYEASVISDAKTLGKFYSRINKTRKPGLPVPQVDFSKNMLLVMCLGEQRGEITPSLKKSEVDDNMLITIELLNDKDASEDKNALTSYPFYIYKLPSTSKTVNIQKLGF